MRAERLSLCVADAVHCLLCFSVIAGSCSLLRLRGRGEDTLVIWFTRVGVESHGGGRSHPI